METLASRIARDGALKPMDAVGWALRLARSLERTHARKNVHGRVAPHCVLTELAECNSVGLLIDPERAPDLVAYHSPERTSGEAPTPSDDTWGVALTLYEALAGKALFEGADDDALRAQILAAHPIPRLTLDVGDEPLQGILDRALARDWMERTNNLTALRRELEAIRPAARFGALPPLIDDTRKPASASQRPPAKPLDDDDDDGPTLVASIRDVSKLTTSKSKPADSEGAPSAAAPAAAAPAAAAPAAAAPAAAPKAPPGRAPLKREGAGGQFDFKGLRSRLLAASDGVPAKLEDDQSQEPSPAAEPEPEPEPEPLPAPELASMYEPEPEPLPDSQPKPQPKPARPPPPPPPKAPPRAVEAPARAKPMEPRKGGGSRWGLVIFVVLLVAGAGAAYRFKAVLLSKLHQLRAPSVDETAALPTATTQAPTAPATPAPLLASAARGTASAAGSSASAASASPSTSAAASSAKTVDVNACVRPLFPPDTFTGDAMPDFSFLCQETDPRRGIASMKTRIVLGNGGHVSEGMREWSLEGWYQLATFAVIRAHCCPSAAPLSLPDAAGRCARIDQRLNELGAATVAVKDVKDAKLKDAVDNFTGAIHCMVRIGTTGAFTRHDNPQGGEDTAFMKMLTRVVGSNQ